MLSNPLTLYPPYQPAAMPDVVPSSSISSNHMHGMRGGLEHLAHRSQYALHQRQQNNVNNHHDSHAARHVHLKHRQHPYTVVAPNTNGRMTVTSPTSSSTPIRRRISRACDQCNQLRTKCDGQNPCAHCVGTNLSSGSARAVLMCF